MVASSTRYSKIRVGADVFANTGFLQENDIPRGFLTAPEVGIVPAIGLDAEQRNLADTNQPFDPGCYFVLSLLGDPDAGRYSHFESALFRFEHEVNAAILIGSATVSSRLIATTPTARADLPSRFPRRRPTTQTAISAA